jgi:flagellin
VTFSPTNITASIAANALRKSTQEIDRAMERLSTGKRINSGEDDAAGIAMSARMKASSLAMRQGLANTNNTISMLQTYESAGQNIRDILIRMKELATQGATSLLTINDRLVIDQEFNLMGQEWIRIAATTKWNGTAGMNVFNNDFKVFLDDQASSMTMTFKSWDPTNLTANQNVSGSTAIMADDNNGNTASAWGFAKVLNNLDTPALGNAKSHSHIQSLTASSNAVAKLDITITGVVRELAMYGGYISRLNFTADALLDVATVLNQSRSIIEDTNYAAETVELTRAQIITQAATAMLAQANQSQQAILALLK